MTKLTREYLIGWTRERLAEGMSIARWARGSVELRSFDAALLAMPRAGAAQDLQFGVGSSAPWDVLSRRVVADWPAGQVMVEMPLVSPEDPEQPEAGITTCQLGREVYAWTPASAGEGSVERAFRAHDPSSLYAAIVVEGRGSISDCSAMETAVASGNLSVVAVVVGALDGEAFVYCSRKSDANTADVSEAD